ncbi:hypothetical protein QC761_604505 [Podospora bellae-mahoneyi]|uniref:Uncharacterized protein n=1 Tax=Podospora bellae-mahoneyi TaxID=2093777 RepID=A0ABR0F850_9PEZI|nr:hypothetical protein QC761_604505 [Podospora bellae-mahoneyi]
MHLKSGDAAVKMHSFSKATALAAASLVTLASAQTRLEIAEQALQNPNATRNITFNPYPDVIPLADLEWTWRVNISDSLTDPFNNRSDDFTVRTSYDLTWGGAPRNSTLAEALPELGNNSFCTVQFLLTDRGWPANITNLWTDKDTDDTSCVPILGPDCVNSIIRSTGLNNGGPCQNPGGTWTDAPECASSLGYMADSRLLPGRMFVDLSKARSGSMFFSLQSEEYSDLDNKTIYGNYHNAIHMMLVNAPVQLVRSLNGGFPTDAPKRLLCMRVNTSQREVVDDEDGNDGGNGGDGGDGGDGGNDNEEGNEGGNGGGGDGGNSAGRDAANWWIMTGALLITVVIGAAL